MCTGEPPRKKKSPACAARVGVFKGLSGLDLGLSEDKEREREREREREGVQGLGCRLRACERERKRSKLWGEGRSRTEKGPAGWALARPKTGRCAVLPQTKKDTKKETRTKNIKNMKERKNESDNKDRERERDSKEGPLGRSCISMTPYIFGYPRREAGGGE